MKKSIRLLALTLMLALMISSMSMTAFATRQINAVPDVNEDVVFDYTDILIIPLRERMDLTALIPQAAGKDIAWTSTNTDVAAVASNGFVKTYQKGTATVTATWYVSETATESAKFYISAVNNVQDDYAVIKMKVGQSFNIVSLFTPALSERTCTGISATPLVVSINNDTGVVTAKDLGTNTVTVKFKDANGDNWSFPVKVQVTE